jgi:hypothetical protein
LGTPDPTLPLARFFGLALAGQNQPQSLGDPWLALFMGALVALAVWAIVCEDHDE